MKKENKTKDESKQLFVKLEDVKVLSSHLLAPRTVKIGKITSQVRDLWVEVTKEQAKNVRSIESLLPIDHTQKTRSTITALLDQEGNKTGKFGVSISVGSLKILELFDLEKDTELTEELRYGDIVSINLGAALSSKNNPKLYLNSLVKTETGVREKSDFVKSIINKVKSTKKQKDTSFESDLDDELDMNDSEESNNIAENNSKDEGDNELDMEESLDDGLEDNAFENNDLDDNESE